MAKHIKEIIDQTTGEILPGYVIPRQPGLYDPRAACEECCIEDWGPSLTQQSQREDADINTIVKRFGLTGTLPQNVRVPEYGDFDGINDYHTAMNAVTAAQSAFNQLPAGIRARFDNDPAKFHDYAVNPENIDGLREMGLAKPKEPNQETKNGPGGNVPPGGTPGTSPKPGEAKGDTGNTGVT